MRLFHDHLVAVDENHGECWKDYMVSRVQIPPCANG